MSDWRKTGKSQYRSDEFDATVFKGDPDRMGRCWIVYRGSYFSRVESRHKTLAEAKHSVAQQYYFEETLEGWYSI